MIQYGTGPGRGTRTRGCEAGQTGGFLETLRIVMQDSVQMEKYIRKSELKGMYCIVAYFRGSIFSRIANRSKFRECKPPTYMLQIG